MCKQAMIHIPIFSGTVEIEIPDDGNECPTAKELVFNRLKKFGGVKWYRYLDMSNQVIRWVNENLEGME